MALVKRLKVKPSSVTGMVKRLAEMDLVTYEPYQGVTLTGTGRKIALQVLRSHRLVELLDIPWDQVYEEADKWEMDTTGKLILVW